jgi:uncharacterized protein (UPF0261 family)
MKRKIYMSKNIVILCSMDTKGEEGLFLKREIEASGFHAVLMDIGIGQEPSISPDISAETVAGAGKGDIAQIRASRDTGAVMSAMIRGAGNLLLDMHEKGDLGGILAFGGASNTTTATSIMKRIPFGIPKLMVSTTAAMPAYAAEYFGTKDITMMHCVVDILGLNDLTRPVLKMAAGGICGMVGASSGAVTLSLESSRIAVTGFKFSEACGQQVLDLLEKKGYTAIPFHAQGVSDKTMEDLIDQGIFSGVIDLVPAGVSEELLGGNRSAGPGRLEAAGRQGIPQVVTPCGFDMLSCGPLSRKDRQDPLWTTLRLDKRKIFIPDEFRVQVRTSPEDLNRIASVVAQKLNKSTGPVKFMIPTKGWSALSVAGADLHEPETDAVFAPALRRHLRAEIELKEIETEFSSHEFAALLVSSLEEMMKK